VSEVFDILTKNPEVWKKTIFILNYDENDGYFDHVPPFVAPKPNDPASGKVSNGIDTSEEYVTMHEELSRTDLDTKDARESPVGLGYRVPMVIASPWSRGGWVNSQVFNITSTLQFLEKFLSKKTGKEIREPNISDWRRMITGDLTSAFRPYRSEKIKLPAFVKKDPFIEKINNAKYKKLPSRYKALSKEEIEQVRSAPFQSSLLPKQEKGIRDSCALPYQLSVDGQLSSDKKTFNISFAAGNEIFGKQSAGAPFSIYAPGKYATTQQINTNPVFENVKTWNYAVKAADELKGEWPLDHFENSLYHLKVYGPNGFFREFKGHKNDPQIEISLNYDQKNSEALSGNVSLTLRNLSNKKQTVEIADTTYKRGTKKIELEKGAEVNEKFDLSGSYNWYDLIVKIKGFDLFEKRYAGRVETGAHSKSDPAMGSMV
jgi:phospholipase C